jgi:23S rRNA pseudouridine955/2504/2580 synthase
MSNSQPKPDQVSFLTIDERDSGQRLDNFLIRICKGVPKSHLYRIVRSGEIRVNKARVDVQYRLQIGDLVRVPPIRLSASAMPPEGAPVHVPALELPVLYEDEGMLVVNKPAGIAVHGGSGVAHGVVERLRSALKDPHAMLELVHRLDRETSGALVLAKKRSYLRTLQEQIRNRIWMKFYSCLVLGEWPKSLNKVDLSLIKVDGPNGEKKVYVNPDGQTACTRFRPLQVYDHPDFGPVTWLEAQLLTGRTHQIRVHTSAKGHCILGDDRYGQFVLNRQWQKAGLNRMFLHATRLELPHPVSGEPVVIEAPLPDMLRRVIHDLTPYAR